jgi:hypothetical protein
MAATKERVDNIRRFLPAATLLCTSSGDAEKGKMET